MSDTLDMQIANFDKMNNFLEKYMTKTDSRKNQQPDIPITIKEIESDVQNLSTKNIIKPRQL